MTTVKDIVRRIEAFAPKYLAEDWDPIGLAFGSYDKEVEKLFVALDLDADTLKEAKEKEADLIFTHHPSIFTSLDTLNEEDARRREYVELIRSNMALYSAHTNIDAAEDGMNDWLAEAIGLEKPYEVIDTAPQADLKLLVLYTPFEDAERIRNELHAVGAGQVGDYRNVSYTSEGKGHFTPEGDANPTIGEKNHSEEVKEERVEMLFPSYLLNRIVHTIYTKHPYEEPVYYILDIGKKDKTFGIGRIGDLKEPKTLDEMVQHVKSSLDLSHVRYVNKAFNRKIEKVAILGGSGEKYYKQALQKGADLYITGDISYHGAQDMIREGLPFIDAGHYIENIFVKKMTERLETWKEEEGWTVEIIPAASQKDVFNFK